jgi:hypothetical protein
VAVGLGLGLCVGAVAVWGESVEGPVAGMGGVPGNGGSGGSQGGGGQGGGGQAAAAKAVAAQAAAAKAAAAKAAAATCLLSARPRAASLGCDPKQVLPDFARLRVQMSVSYWATGRAKPYSLSMGNPALQQLIGGLSDNM